MKNSIAKKVTGKIAQLLIIALACLLVVSFLIVSFVVRSRNQNYARSIVSVYADSIMEKSDWEKIPVDLEHPDACIYYGQYLCFWMNVQNAYVYIPNIEDGTRTYININKKTGLGDEKVTDYKTGYVFKREPTKEELEVWEGKRTFATVVAKNAFGHSIGTIMQSEDSFGNKVIVGIDLSYATIMSQIAGACGFAVFFNALIILAIYFAVYRFLRNKVSYPAQRIANAMNDYIVDGKRTSVHLDEHGFDEYSMISNSFNSMTAELDTYLENIKALNKDKAHQKAELDIAAGIQRGFLPKEHFFDGRCELNAVMNPAKNIGGDLYDYMPLENNRMLVVIGDVSGKGVSASIFMAVTLMIIRQYAKFNISPSEILEKANETLSDNNAELLFATVFVGIYDKNTDEFTFSNAGHNPPYILSDKLRTLETEIGTPLGLFSGEKYGQSAVKLHAGDKVFLYTDGVTEAINRESEFYSIKRLEKELEKNIGSDENIVSLIENDVKGFSGNAEQHDDITMLSLTIKGAAELTLDFYVNEMTKIKSAIISMDIPKTVQHSLCLVAEEYFVNICSYAFENGVPEGEKIRFVLSVTNRVEMTFEDGGQPFDPLQEVDIDDYDIDIQIGGLGRFIAMSYIDDAKYEYVNNKNVLKLVKYFKEENK